MRNTKTLFGYCVYCGKESLKDFEFDEYTKYDYTFCDCVMAKREIDLHEQIEMLQMRMPREDYNVVNKIKLRKELRKLKNEYATIYQEIINEDEPKGN